ncbi:permease, partial [Chloroflexota bacterium]
AINVLAIVYSARLLGFDLGIGRAVGAVAFSVLIGTIMAAIYGREDERGDSRAFDMLQEEEDGQSMWVRVALFALLVGILIAAASAWWVVTGVLLVALGVLLWKRFSREDIRMWMQETWRFVKLITPWLLGGVFVAGMLRVLLPESAVAAVVGGNSLLSNFIASFAGSLMYFATLTEVPIVKAFLDLGMGRGPALALLLAGPALSIPNMLVIRSIMGTRKTLAYVTLVVVMATISGYVYGMLVA